MLFQQLSIDLDSYIEKQLKNYDACRQDYLELLPGNLTIQVIMMSPFVEGEATKIRYPLQIQSHFG